MGSRPPRNPYLGEGTCSSLSLPNAAEAGSQQPTEVALKLCYCCKELVPMTQFYATPRNKDGLQGSCIPCFNRHGLYYRMSRLKQISAKRAKKRGRPMKRRAYKTKYNPLGLPPEQRTLEA